MAYPKNYDNISKHISVRKNGKIDQLKIISNDTNRNSKY